MEIIPLVHRHPISACELSASKRRYQTLSDNCASIRKSQHYNTRVLDINSVIPYPPRRRGEGLAVEK